MSKAKTPPAQVRDENDLSPQGFSATIARHWETIFVVAVVAVFGLYVLRSSMPRGNDGPLDLNALAGTPVLAGGRAKPMDTFARTTLLSISKRTTFIANGRRDDPVPGVKQDEAEGEERPAIAWLLEVMADTDASKQYEVIRIEDLDVIDALGLPQRHRFRYSIDDFFRNEGAAYNELTRLTDPLIGGDPDDMTTTQQALFDVRRHLSTIGGIRAGAAPLEVPTDWREAIKPKVIESRDGRKTEVTGYKKPIGPGLTEVLADYKKGDIGSFNTGIRQYNAMIHARDDSLKNPIRVELFYNNAEFFIQCIAMYIAAFLLVAFGWLGWTRPLHRAAFWLLVLAVVVHFGAMLVRMYLMDRPLVFVTNLYSSAIFIAFGGVVFGLVIERFFRNGLALSMAAVIGIASLIVAQNLQRLESKDQLEMMQAVLDTNFWLATHVTTVTLGYSATYLAGFLGIVFVIAGVFTPILDKDARRMLTRMIYGTVCFSVLLSFIGTVLGGIWADQSWGRFWGWDPKENGALMIVIWSALILHAKWAGWFRERGIAVAAIFGNIMVSWSWFGTNQLGAGLHAYGFSKVLATGLVVFGATQLVLIAIGMMPLKWWRSYAAVTPPGSAPPPTPKRKRDKPGGKGSPNVAPA